MKNTDVTGVGQVTVTAPSRCGVQRMETVSRLGLDAEELGLRDHFPGAMRVARATPTSHL